MKKAVCLLSIIIFSWNLFCEEAAVEEDVENSTSIEEITEDEETEEVQDTENITILDEPLTVKNFINRSFFSFDLSYIGLNFKGGFGLGFYDELKVWRYNSVRLGFANYYLFPQTDDIDVVIGVRPTVDLLTYPFGNGMDKLYFGFGCGTDFLSMAGQNIEEELKHNTVISLFSMLGWKQYFSSYLMADFFVGYRFIINQNDVYEPYLDYVKHGVEYGVKFKLNIKKIWGKMKNRS